MSLENDVLKFTQSAVKPVLDWIKDMVASWISKSPRLESGWSTPSTPKVCNDAKLVNGKNPQDDLPRTSKEDSGWKLSTVRPELTARVWKDLSLTLPVKGAADTTDARVTAR